MPDRLGDAIRLRHIFDAIEAIESYTKHVTKEEFWANSMMFNATLRQLEIIGEASNRLSEDFLQQNNDIPWNQLIGLRNIVIHEYFGIDDMMIWNIIQRNIPELKSKIKELL